MMDEHLKWANFTAEIDEKLTDLAIENDVSPLELTKACLSIACRLATVYSPDQEEAADLFDKAKKALVNKWDSPSAKKMREEAELANGVK